MPIRHRLATDFSPAGERGNGMEELPDLEAGTDAYGEAIRDCHEGDDAFEVVERDDGWVGPSNGPMLYFERYEEWDEHVQRAIERARGRVLDVGVGAGRHALHLQDQGHDVTGVDVSPGALAVARDRGVDDVRECDVAAVTNEFDPDTFETVLMLGNNFGLVGTADRTPAILDELATVTTDDATILAGSANPLATDDPHHREYHEFNRDRGRLPGALRIRVRYKTYATDWFDYLLAAPEEMAEVVADTDWTLADTVVGEEGNYVGVLERT
jgi:SAM-dependent methyltransferase